MGFWILAALLTAGSLAAILGPLRREHKKLTIALTVIVPLAALAGYFLIGNPDLLP